MLLRKRCVLLDANPVFLVVRGGGGGGGRSGVLMELGVEQRRAFFGGFECVMKGVRRKNGCSTNFFSELRCQVKVDFSSTR